LRRRALPECACAWIRRIFKLTNRINCRCVRETRPGSTVRYGISEAHHSETHCRNPGLEKLTGPRIIEGDSDYSLTGDLSCFILPTRRLTNTLLSLRVSDYITSAKTSRLWYGLRIGPQNIGQSAKSATRILRPTYFLDIEGPNGANALYRQPK